MTKLNNDTIVHTHTHTHTHTHCTCAPNSHFQQYFNTSINIILTRTKSTEAISIYTQRDQLPTRSASNKGIITNSVNKRTKSLKPTCVCYVGVTIVAVQTWADDVRMHTVHRQYTQSTSQSLLAILLKTYG